MSDLSFLADSTQDVGVAIDELLKARNKPRGYMGLSQAGLVNECQRKAWYMMNGYPAKEHEGRLLRLFRSGDDVETNMVLDLKDIGLTVHSCQKEVGANYGDDTLKGHIDGIIEGLDAFGLGKKPCLFECKSCNDKKFAELKKLGDYGRWNMVYKAQVHIYALLLKLDRIFVAVENKNTSERYFQRFERDSDFALETLQKAFLVKKMQAPPPRCQDRPDFFSCKWCDYYNTCFGNN